MRSGLLRSNLAPSPDGLPARKPGTDSAPRVPSDLAPQRPWWRTVSGPAPVLASEAEELRRWHEQLGEGEPLDSAARARMERGFGTDLQHLRVHTGGAAAGLAERNAGRAFALGNHLAFGAGQYRSGGLDADLLLAHEIAHSLQQGGRGAALSGHAAEHQADRAALRAVSRSHGGSALPAREGLTQGGGLALRRCSRSRSEVQRALDGEVAWTPSLAQQALDQYRAMSESDRQSTFDRYYPTGSFARLLRALPPGAASGAYNDMVQDVLRRAQRRGAVESGSASGLRDEGAMAQTQADFMRARNEAAARAAQPSAAPPPSPAQVAAQQQSQVAQTSIPTSSSALSAAEVATWTTRANTAVAAIVTYARAHHPELNLTAADFHVDVVGIENRGLGVIAYGEVLGGRNVAVVGRTFVRYVDANPAYAMSVIVHELHGHPEYGPYGAAGSEFGLTLYDTAAARMPGYRQPAGTGRTSEIDAYAYQETEIYSLLRSLPYHTPLAPAHTAMQPDYVDPEPTVRARIGIIKTQWEPRVAKALLRGMYQRFRIDPRLAPAAVRAFERAVRANFPGAQSTAADDILR